MTSTGRDSSDERQLSVTETARMLASQAATARAQRINLLSASAIVVTQLPAAQLAPFVRRSAHLSVRLQQLAESLDSTGNALAEYAAAREQTDHADSASAPPGDDTVVDLGPRTLQTGAPAGPRLLPTDSVAEHLVGEVVGEAAPAGDFDAAAATPTRLDEIDFLRRRCIEVLTDQITFWEANPVQSGPVRLSDEAQSQAGSAAASTQAPTDVRTDVIAVDLPADATPGKQFPHPQWRG